MNVIQPIFIDLKRQKSIPKGGCTRFLNWTQINLVCVRKI